MSDLMLVKRSRAPIRVPLLRVFSVLGDRCHVDLT